MQRLILKFLMIAASTLCFISVAQGQTLFGQTFKSPSVNSTNPRGPVQPNPIVSPNDFGNMVSGLDNQTKNRLANQYNQQLRKQQPPPPSPPAQAASPFAPTSVMNIEPGPETTSAGQAQSPSMNLPPQQLQVNPGIPTPNTTPSPLLSQPPAQSQVYTGFGSGNQNPQAPAPGAAPPAQSGGGWNIKY